MQKLVNGVVVDLTAEEITQREAEALQAEQDRLAQVEAERVADIWKQIHEQEQLAIRAVLNNDTEWIEIRKANIATLKGAL